MTPQSSHPIGRKVRAATATLLASASIFAFSATAATADTGSGSVIQEEDCFTPNHVKADHTKPCGIGWAFVSYKYQYEFHVHGNVWCFVFDATYFGCGGPSPIGEELSCAAGH